MISAAASQFLTTASATGRQAGANAEASSANPFGSTSVADSELAAEKEALSRLKAVSASASAGPSDLAKAKLNALKERLKLLMMMGGDPKTVAREAAAIAKEIGQAAKSYADASGGSDGGAAAEASSEAASAQQAAAGAAAQADAAPAQATGGQAPQPAASADPPKGDGTSADPTAASAPAQPQTPGQAAAQATPQTATGGAHKSKLPDPVIEEARALEASAQALAKAALQKLKAQHKTNPDATKEQAELDQGQKDFTDAAKEVYGNDDGVAGDPSPADAASGYTANGSAPAPTADAPLVSVTA